MYRAVSIRVFCFSVLVIFFSTSARAQQSTSQLGNVLNAPVRPGNTGFEAVIETSNLDVNLQQQNGAPIEGTLIVMLLNLSGQVYRQTTTKEAHLRFNDIAPTEYRVQVVSPVYAKVLKEVVAPANASTQVTIVLQPLEGMDVGMALSLSALKPRAQKQVAKAMDALRANKPEAASGYLAALSREVPNHPEVTYLQGVYASELKDWGKAKAEWLHTIELNRRHVRALLSLAEVSILEKKSKEAIEYARRAVEADSGSWRAHALLAEGYTLQGTPAETIQESERAIELARGKDTGLEPLLARALAQQSDKKRATAVLQPYVEKHPNDSSAKKQLDMLNAPEGSGTASAQPVTAEDVIAAATREAVLATMGRATWMPPDIDSSVPPVEAGASCPLDEVVQKVGGRMEEFVHNVNRFTATELVKHESINGKGFASAPESAKYDYLVSVDAAQPGRLSFDEYRQNKTATAGFPEATMTDGLPGLVLMFHPYYAKNYAMTCEGLSRWNGQLTWQIRFEQRKDRPDVLRSYRVGVEGQSYPVALKGRAWIGLETNQIMRMETDLVAPLPQIRLALDHIAVEYAPVHFRQGAVDMWLPQSAEVFYEWRGHRVHRVHTFSQYMLFSVDDKQKISAPKGQDPQAPESENPN
jgi:tetratricopeptide (TPR) repeat protein